MAAALGDRRAVLRDHLRPRPGRLSRGARSVARASRRDGTHERAGARRSPRRAASASRASSRSASSTRCSSTRFGRHPLPDRLHRQPTLAVVSVHGGEAGEDAPRNRFLSDFRYAAQSAEQVPDVFERQIVTGELLGALAGTLAGTGGRLGFDDASLTVKQHARLQELLGRGWERSPAAGARSSGCARSRRRARSRAFAPPASSPTRRCGACSKAAWRAEPSARSRSSWSCACDGWARRRRASRRSSRPARMARCPHAEPRAGEIARDVLVTIDWGAWHEGYCSDCTRTYATGEQLPAEAREVYELVLAAQQQGLDAVAAGLSGREADAVAREVIEEGGEGAHFGHGLGHGVGIEVHEGPRLSRTAPRGAAARRAMSSRSSPVCICRVCWACGSRTWWLSERTLRRCSRACPRSSRSSPERASGRRRG